MDAASLSEIKKTLIKLDHDELLAAVLRLARFKKENKELLTYLLFMSENEQGYANYLCGQIDDFFAESGSTMHKKTLRKIIRWMNKCLRFSGDKETAVQVRMHFCQTLNESGIKFRTTKVMFNMYAGQIKKIEKLIEKFHPDLQFDFSEKLKKLH
jgi:hypothetical protein